MKAVQNIFMNGGNPTTNVPLSVTVEAKGKVCYIAITGHISEWSPANAGTVLKEIKSAKDDGAKECEIYVNTRGGNVFEANEILNLIEDNFEADNIKVRVGALCASAGTIFPAKYHATGKSNTQCMIHKPSMYLGGNEDEIEANLKLLKDLTKQYKAMYAKKFGIKEKEVEALWAKGDYWMNSQAAKKIGLLDVVESDDEKIDANTRLQLVACGAPTIPQIKNEKQIKNVIRMELSVLAVQLGLPSTATQVEVDAKLKAIQTQASKADGLEKAAKDKELAKTADAIKSLLDNAEVAKKIDATMRGNYEAIGKNNLEQLTAILKDMPKIEAISGQIIKTKSEIAAEAGREKWTFADYQEKDPEAYMAMAKTDPEKAQALVDAHYKDD